MEKSRPTVYLFHGDNEFEIAQLITELKNKMGDPSAVTLNFTQLEGRSTSLSEIAAATRVIPFLADRRLVVLTNPLVFGESKTAREKFFATLEAVPLTTALVLVEDHPLTAWKDRKRGKYHWLEQWAMDSDRAYIKLCEVPRGAAMASWIQKRAVERGGQFSYQAADRMVNLVGESPRSIDQEIEKLLLYVNFHRPVELDDVEKLTANTREGDIFAMVDALGEKDGRLALRMLRRLLADQEPLPIFGMIVRQFRLLLLTREILDNGGGEPEVIQQLKIHPFVAKKVMGQARHFDLDLLDRMYRRLIDFDEAMKTSAMEPSLSLEMLIADFTL